MNSPTKPDVGPYHSSFTNWDERASVRTKPRRTITETDTPPMFFPPEFVPALRHPLVSARGPELTRDLLVHSLYQYLHFTTVLEQVAVLPMTGAISLDRAGFDLPDRMRDDAFKITTDEAWHAQFSHEFIHDVARFTDVAPRALVEPALVGRLARIRADFAPDYTTLVDMVFAVVSETLVSGLLSEIPKDRRLPGPVRELVADHAADEGRHHAYFRAVLCQLWPQLARTERRLIGPAIPRFVHAFLDTDVGSARTILRNLGFNRQDTAEIVTTFYAGQRSVVTEARATTRAFTEVGALTDPATQEAFAQSGLLPAR